jgi:hypothetical protein
MGCSGGTENPDVSITLIQIPMEDIRYNLFGCIRHPWEIFLEQQEINTCDKLIANERVGFILHVLPQDVEIHMDREI